MSNLTAIVGPNSGPGHGECFIWKSDANGRVVAVDSGGAAAIGQRAASHNPEILVLSHDDNDHIRGGVDLINAASASLAELWIPSDWAILIKQIAETDQNNLLPANVGTISTENLAASIADQIRTNADGSGSVQMSQALLASAGENLASWESSQFRPDQGFSMQGAPVVGGRWYGSTDLNEIIQRVKFRAVALIDILTAAVNHSVLIRYFSIDLALSSTSRKWETEGLPGTATLANAAEAPHSLAVRIPPGLPYTYALTRLTVQNRRALCTLLWSEPTTPDGGVAIWSDTDGTWLDHSSPLGLGKVVRTLRASSAPHHASGNTAHDRVWTELQQAPKSLIMISAGGQKNQAYSTQYRALNTMRCCTWCRNASNIYQEVHARSTSGGPLVLQTSCLGVH